MLKSSHISLAFILKHWRSVFISSLTKRSFLIELSGLVKKIAAKSCSLDPVPASPLRYCIDDLLPIIRRVVSLPFNSASMRTFMKNAVLSPLLKKPSLFFSDFRPVTNLKFWSKVIEKSCSHKSDELFV